jgi:hypothetical protein
MMHCVQCDTELVAPVRSEYWSDMHACHVWHYPKCCVCSRLWSPFLIFNRSQSYRACKKGRLSAPNHDDNGAKSSDLGHGGRAL